MKDLQQLTLDVCEVARRAGAYIRKERAGFQLNRVERKHAHDYVSYVDKGSEQCIVEALRTLLPEAGFLTEESGEWTVENEMHDAQLQWVVDPLDGTTNFIHGFAPYAVSIALLRANEILIGVVYEIVADECFYAWREGGAWMNGQAIYVSQQKLNDALLSLQYPYNSEAYSPVIQRLVGYFYGRVASIRSMGSAAMSLCYVAAGRLDGYAEKYIGRWDYMAGGLIVKEAGGRVTSFEGADDFTTADGVLATNGIIHDEVMRTIDNSH